ncbi:MAG: rhodanese-like domain-containing protein [Bacteroidetes bacterium]|nr:rhodanese-like domain-containing protein [Bacteroidota bacterium]
MAVRKFQKARSPREFSQNHVKGSVNIPLDSIPSQLAKFNNKKHIIVFCLSGNRSSQAKSFLEQNGFENVVNGGTVESVNQFMSQYFVHFFNYQC